VGVTDTEEEGVEEEEIKRKEGSKEGKEESVKGEWEMRSRRNMKRRWRKTKRRKLNKSK
jgi:hypothetical protein